MALQHAIGGLEKKLALRREFLASASPGAVYLPFCGDGDIAKELYLDRPIFAVDLDREKVRSARMNLPASPGLRVLRHDADRIWPFGREIIAIADFDAWNNPYPAIALFWAKATKTSRLIMFGTDSIRYAIKRHGRVCAGLPDGKMKTAPKSDSAAQYDSWFPGHALPWLRSLAGAKILRHAHEYHGAEGMTYWAAEVEVSGSALDPQASSKPSARSRRPRKDAKVSLAQVLAAVVEHHGLITKAADALGISYQAIQDRMRRHPEVREARQEATERLHDAIQARLFRIALGEESAEKDIAAIFFELKCRAKDRGYIERVEYDPVRMSDEDLNGRIADYIRKAGVARSEEHTS